MSFNNTTFKYEDAKKYLEKYIYTIMFKLFKYIYFYLVK